MADEDEDEFDYAAIADTLADEIAEARRRSDLDAKLVARFNG